MKNSYNVKALFDMAQEYLNAENEYRVFCLAFKGGWVPDCPKTRKMSGITAVDMV